MAVEKLLQVVRGIDGDGAVFQLGDIVGPESGG